MMRPQQWCLTLYYRPEADMTEEPPLTNQRPNGPGPKHRFYVSDLSRVDGLGSVDSHDQVVQLNDQQTHHALDVLRLKPGETVELFDGCGIVVGGQMETNGRVRPVSFHQVPQPAKTIDMAVSLPKGSRSSDMISGLSQLGVDRVIPLRTARSVVHPRQGKLLRLRTAVIESAKQCGRAHLMEIAETTSLVDALHLNYDLRLIAQPRVPYRGQSLCNAQRVLILIGPEGGWTAEEIDMAEQQGCDFWNIGPYVMRIETAALAAAGIVQLMHHEAL